MDVLIWTFYTIFLFILLSLVLGSFFTVSTAQVAVITRFGKFLRVAEPGLNWKWPYHRYRRRHSQPARQSDHSDHGDEDQGQRLRHHSDFGAEPVRPEKVYDAFYKLADPVAQIQSYVEQVILGHVPGMTLDEVFASQSGIAAAVKQELDVDMAAFGYEIVNVLVTDIVPDAKVKSAMNDINAAQREQVAANCARRGGKDPGGQEGRGRSREQGAARAGHRQPKKGNHRGTAAARSSNFRKRRRRLDLRSHAARSGHAVFRYAQVDRRDATRPTRCSCRTRRAPCARFPIRSCSRCWAWKRPKGNGWRCRPVSKRDLRPPSGFAFPVAPHSSPR